MIPGSPIGPPACEGYQAVATDGGYLHVARVHCPGCAESARLRERLELSEDVAATTGAVLVATAADLRAAEGRIDQLEHDNSLSLAEIARLETSLADAAALRERVDELRTELESHANQEESWKTQVDDLREQLRARDARIIELERLLDVKRQADKPRYCKNCPFAEFLHPTPYGCVFEADDAQKPGEPS